MYSSRQKDLSWTQRVYGFFIGDSSSDDDKHIRLSVCMNTYKYISEIAIARANKFGNIMYVRLLHADKVYYRIRARLQAFSMC